MIRRFVLSGSPSWMEARIKISVEGCRAGCCCCGGGGGAFHIMDIVVCSGRLRLKWFHQSLYLGLKIVACMGVTFEIVAILSTYFAG